MCGIFGYLSADPGLDESRALATAVEAIRHRGPDDRGTFRGEHGRHRVGFAFTRLAIIDLSPSGHQPMTTEDGRFTIVFNGEVYNFQEIRDELVKLGAVFRSRSDTEVVLRAYARWGREAVTRFRGMFALGIWDALEGTLFLARDRLGIKPLYYVHGRAGLAFASEVRALLATGFAERRLSTRALAGYLTFGAVPGPETIVEGVTELPAGHSLLVRDGELVERAYWALPIVPERGSSFAEEVSAIQPILLDAVRLRLIADVPVGIFLSGGIDSSALVALATRASGVPVHTFTVTFDEERYSEATYAAEVARRYGSEHHDVRLPAEEAMKSFGDAVRALDQPSADGVNTYFVSKAARAAGLSVALSGLGGDELFAGYGAFRSFGRLQALARGVGRLPGGARRALDASTSLPFAPARLRKLGMVLAGGGSMAATYAALRAMFTPDERRALLAADVAAARDAPLDLGVLVPGDLARLEAEGRIGPVNAYAALELSNYLRIMLLRDTDAMSMAHPIEVRVPLLDHVLVERVMRSPSALKLAFGENKPMLTAAAGGLPAAAVDRPKMGFTLPFDAWFKGPLRPLIEDVLLGDAVRRAGFLDREGVAELWRAFLSGDRRTTHWRVWCVTALAWWCNVNGVGL